MYVFFVSYHCFYTDDLTCEIGVSYSFHFYMIRIWMYIYKKIRALTQVNQSHFKDSWKIWSGFVTMMMVVSFFKRGFFFVSIFNEKSFINYVKRKFELSHTFPQEGISHTLSPSYVITIKNKDFSLEWLGLRVYISTNNNEKNPHCLRLTMIRECWYNTDFCQSTIYLYCLPRKDAVRCCTTWKCAKISPEANSIRSLFFQAILPHHTLMYIRCKCDVRGL